MLGRTGRNFAAGMSGGIAYVLDMDGTFARRCNLGMVALEPLVAADDVHTVRDLMSRHVAATRSAYAGAILGDWAATQRKFIKVMPKDYKRVLQAEAKARAESRERSFPSSWAWSGIGLGVPPRIWELVRDRSQKVEKSQLPRD